MNIELYELCLPKSESAPTALYIRTEGTVTRTANHLQLACESAVSFDTWFGCFDYLQWRRYTTLTTPIATFFIKGTMLVQCYVRTAERTSLLYEQTVTSDGSQPQVFPFSISNLLENGFLYFRLQAKSENCLFLRGCYLADVSELHAIQVAAVICTYQRESWVSNTLQQFLQWQKEHHTLPVDIFLIDNGQTWTEEQLPDSNQIHLIPNQNTGGSGGFTRGIQEALHREQYTHVLLMDDDIIADWNGVQRAISFLSICKPEQWEALTIGGTMMDIMQPAMQFEAGACCQNRCLTGIQPQADLTKHTSLLARIQPIAANYAAWWMCFLPIAAIKKAGLPMPFFIKMDDVEYALQIKEQVVMMTGVCVWHENFHLKYAPWNEYYITRNGCITYALHGQAKNAVSVVLELWRTMLHLLFLHRYDTAKFVLQGYRDFLRGWKWLKKTDAITLHRQILQQQQAATEQFQTDCTEVPNSIPQVSFFEATRAAVQKQKSVFLFHPFTKKGFYASRKKGTAFQLLLKMGGISLRMLATYRSVVQGFQKNRTVLCEDAAWNQRNQHNSEKK